MASQITKNATMKMTLRRLLAAISLYTCPHPTCSQLADLPKHEQTLERIRSLGRHTQRLAVHVARGAQLYEGLNPKIANDTLRALQDTGIIEQTIPRQWHITDPLLRNFLADLDHSG